MFQGPYNQVMPQSCVIVTMKSTSLLVSFSLGLMVKLVATKEVDLGEVLNPVLEGRPLFEDVAYDSNIAFEIFMDEDESFNIAERNKEGPKAPKFSILKTDDSESSDKKDEKNLNPDIHSRSSSFSTHIVLFVGLIVCLKIIF